MDPAEQIVFGPFHFDGTTRRLWQVQREIRLRPRTRAVLHYLLEHPGRVIARQEFAQHVWASTHVTHSVLRVCIWELRQALGDAGATPQYIETHALSGRSKRETGDSLYRRDRDYLVWAYETQSHTIEPNHPAF
jgi:DNA-binding winged helix-turn-helix (wHTH) protein